MKAKFWFILIIPLVSVCLTFCDRVEEFPDESQANEGDSPAKRLPVIQDTRVRIIALNEASLDYTIADDGGGKIIKHGICWDICPFPYSPKNVITGSSPVQKDQFLILNAIIPDTRYYARAFATNSLGTVFGEEVSFTITTQYIQKEVFNPELHYGSVSDIDGNTYKTILIGTQTWMAENLKTTKYNDGTPISNLRGNYDFAIALTGAYRWFNNDMAHYKVIYGAIYNWNAVATDKLCPAGWHVPSDAEWRELELTLGMTWDQMSSYDPFLPRGTMEGNQLKANVGWNDWKGLTGNGTNSSGFSALPAGGSGWYGEFGGIGRLTDFYAMEEGMARTLTSADGGIYSAAYPKQCGFSVRCLKN